MEEVLQQVALDEMLPIFSEGEVRMIEEKTLSPLTAVRTHFNMRAIIDLLKLPPKTEDLQVQIDYVSKFIQPQIKHLRLLKVELVDEAINQHNSAAASSLKHTSEHTSFKQPSLEAQKYGYRLAWWLLLGPSIICLLFRLQINSLAELSALEQE